MADDAKHSLHVVFGTTAGGIVVRWVALATHHFEARWCSSRWVAGATQLRSWPDRAAARFVGERAGGLPRRLAAPESRERAVPRRGPGRPRLGADHVFRCAGAVLRDRPMAEGRPRRRRSARQDVGPAFHQTGDLVLWARVRGLAAVGRLESQGDLSSMRHSELRRAQTQAAS